MLDLLGRLVDQQQAALDKQLEAASGPRAELDALVDAFLAVGNNARPEAVASWVTIGTEAIRQPELAEAFAAALGTFGDQFDRVLAAGIDEGVFDPGDLSRQACVAAILATIEGYFTLAAIDRSIVPAGSAAPATRRMLAGLLGI